jgi:hypothetical protein
LVIFVTFCEKVFLLVTAQNIFQNLVLCGDRPGEGVFTEANEGNEEDVKT